MTHSASRTSTILTAALAIVFASPALAEDKPKDRLEVLHYEKDYDSALAKAKAESKLVLLYVTTPCHT